MRSVSGPTSMSVGRMSSQNSRSATVHSPDAASLEMVPDARELEAGEFDEIHCDLLEKVVEFLVVDVEVEDRDLVLVSTGRLHDFA